MAMRVPTVAGPSIADQPLQAAPQRSSATPALLAGGAPQQLADAGRAMAEIGAKMQDREDADLVMRANATYEQQYVQKAAEAKQLRGQAAWGVTKDMSQWLDDSASKVSETLTNDRQRFLFNQTVQKLRSHALGTFSEFEAGQKRASLAEAAQASVVSSINLAAANSQDPGVISAAKRDVLARTQTLAQLNGWSPELRDAKTSEALTNLHNQVLQDLVSKDPSAAEAYFSANKGEIAGSQQAEIEKYLKVATTTRKAQEFADEVMASNMDEAAALAEARKRFDGDTEQHAVAEIKTRFGERTMARERMQRDAADEAFGVYARTGSIAAVPPAAIAKMDGRTLLSLRQQAQHDAEGREVKTNMSAYYALSRLADSDPEAFARRDLRGDFAALSKADQKHFVDLQSKIRTPEEQIKESAINRQLTVTFRTMGWGEGDGDLKKKGAFEKAVRDEMRTTESALKRPMNGLERQQLIDRLLLEGQIDGSGLLRDDRGRLFEFRGRPDAGNFVPDIDDRSRKMIVQALQAEGNANPTDQQIARRFKLRFGLR